jgi:hypothetical protein
MNSNKRIDPEILISRFRRKKVNSKIIKVFDSFSDNIKISILSRIDLLSGEIPILLSFLSLNQWLLFTTIRISWCKSGVVKHIDYENIKSIDWDQETFWRTKDISYMNETTELIIFTELGEKIRVETGESGSNLFAFLSTIQWLINRTKAPTEAEI